MATGVPNVGTNQTCSVGIDRLKEEGSDGKGEGRESGER